MRILILLAMISLNTQALELFSYKDSAVTTGRMSDGAIEKIWASSEPTCLKDGAKLLGVNKAYKAAGLGYRDCSSSKNAMIKHNALGIKVNVIKLTQLSDSMIKKVLGK